MTAAIFGLIGVIVGGALNGLVAAMAERRRDRREARSAARLLGRELAGALYGVREWLHAGNAGQPSRDDVLRFPAWKQYHAISARTFPAHDWDAVSDAYLLLYTVRTRRDFAGALGEQARAHLESAEAAIVEAIAALRPIADAAIARPGAESSPSKVEAIAALRPIADAAIARPGAESSPSKLQQAPRGT